MRKKGSSLGCLSLILLLLIACAAGIYAWKRYGPTKEPADLDELYQVRAEDEVTVFLNYEMQEARGIYEEGQTYLPIDWVNKNLNERFYWDNNEDLLVYALPDEILTAPEGTKGAGGRRLFIRRGEDVLLSLGLVLNYTDIRVNAYDSGKQKRVFIQDTWDEVPVAVISKDSRVRVKGGVKSPVITNAVKGEDVIVLETMERWSKVLTRDGHIGYMPGSRLTDLKAEKPVSSFKAPVYQNISLDEKITLVWHQVTLEAANGVLEELLAQTKGINVIAPTWFTLSDNEGNYESLADKSYVEKAHEKGIQVWAVVDNFSRECSKNVRSEVLLSKTSVRKRLIENLMKEADTYGFDGINLDFESLKEEAGVHYIEFIRELSVSCRRKGLVLSVDNYVPAGYNHFYNRREQGIVADYVIIMGYDEHYAGGEAGSVASIGYVEDGIRNTLELVPREKVINAVPFYTRLWTQSGEKLSSKAMGISTAKKWIEEQEAQLQWNEELGQYYTQVETEDGESMLWMEDSRSLKLKMDVIKKEDLAGVACWKLGLEPQEIWDVIGWE